MGRFKKKKNSPKWSPSILTSLFPEVNGQLEGRYENVVLERERNSNKESNHLRGSLDRKTVMPVFCFCRKHQK